MSELSTRVRLRREELGLSQEELAQRMGYRSKSSITKLEKGVNDIPQAKLEELAQALETTPAYLLGLDAPCPPPPGFEPLPAMTMVPLVGRTVYRGACRMARRLCADLPRRQHEPHHLRWGHRVHPLPAGSGAGRDRGGAHRRRSYPETLPPAGRYRDAAGGQRRRLPAHDLHRPTAGGDPDRGQSGGLLPGAVTDKRSGDHVLFQKEGDGRV